MHKIKSSLLSVCAVSFLGINVVAGGTSQTASGSGHTLTIGEHNTIENKARIVKNAYNTRAFPGYNSQTARQDLEKGNYKEVFFEDKKAIKPSSRKTLLILTATNFETGVIQQEAKRAGLTVQKDMIHDHIVYRLGTLGGVDVVQMQPAMMGMLEPNSTPLMLMSVFRDLRPDYIIATGIAFGRQAKGHALGDILVSRQVANYETRKESNGNIYFRGDKVTSPMLERINAGIHNWQGAKVHPGLVLSGNVLVNSKEFLEHIGAREPEYEGGEMEAYGAYAVASMMGAQWIMIKGISDWGDGSKNDAFHKVALENAGQFIFHVIKEGNLK